jgi:hypothetical protein
MNNKLTHLLRNMAVTDDVKREDWEGHKKNPRDQYSRDYNYPSDVEDLFESLPDSGLHEGQATGPSISDHLQPNDQNSAKYLDKANSEYSPDREWNAPDNTPEHMSIDHESSKEDQSQMPEPVHKTQTKRKRSLAEDNTNPKKRIKIGNRSPKHAIVAQTLYIHYTVKAGYETGGGQLDKDQYINALPAAFRRSPDPERFPSDTIQRSVIAADQAATAKKGFAIRDGVEFLHKVTKQIMGYHPGDARRLQLKTIQLRATENESNDRRALVTTFWPILQSHKSRVDGQVTRAIACLDEIKKAGTELDDAVGYQEKALQTMKIWQVQIEEGMKLVQEGR